MPGDLGGYTLHAEDRRVPYKQGFSRRKTPFYAVSTSIVQIQCITRYPNYLVRPSYATYKNPLPPVHLSLGFLLRSLEPQECVLRDKLLASQMKHSSLISSSLINGECLAIAVCGAVDIAIPYCVVPTKRPSVC